MQTFLPFASFTKSASVLDYRRLGKQRVECAQLIKAIEDDGGWASHPAAHMWTGYVPALKLYMDACVDEWVRRGYKNSYPLHYDSVSYEGSVPMPPWLGDEAFHSSHRRALLLKSDYYDQFDWDEALDNNWDSALDQIYWWPRLQDDPLSPYVLRKKGDY